jgi:hypothetical protein
VKLWPKEAREEAMTGNSIEISVGGKWVRVPALDAGNGKTMIVTGRRIRVAAIHDEEWLETELEDPELCVRKLKDQRSPELRADIFAFTQKLPATLPKYGYHMEWESLAAVRLTSFKAWWEKLPQGTRKNVRRSQKRGVVVTVREFNAEVIRELVELNNESPVRQGKPNRHHGKTFEQVQKDYSSFLDRSDLICAHVGHELIGLLKIVYRGEVASILQCLPKASHFDKNPANALVAKAMELCEARAVSYVTYGMFRYGNKRHDPLLEFKIHNGFEEVLVPRFYVPLTRWGAVCIGIGLHRGLLGILPPKVIMLGAGARAKWRNLKQSTSRCSSTAEQLNRNRQMECANPPAGSNP